MLAPRISNLHLQIPNAAARVQQKPERLFEPAEKITRRCAATGKEKN
jgi:hypothetical protein